MVKHMVLQKYYVYDPGLHAGDELGGLRVLEDQDKDGALHVLASPLMIQYWIDQGLIGLEPLDRLGDSQKKFLAQITRGRSEDEEPKRLPKYSKRTQSGSPSFAATPASVRMKERNKAAKKTKGKEKPVKRSKREEHPITGPAPAE
jgi:hypothetical protein